ncbi:MAG: hypothetical protein AAF489_04025 [Bacteroidota bacterium]
MKPLKQKLKSVAAFLAILVLSQGCTAYKGSITLDQAVAEKQKVKVTTKDNPKPYEFSKIELVDGKYIGFPKRYKSTKAVELKRENISLIKEHDKTTSNIITFSPLALIVGLGILLFSTGSEDYNGG